MAFRIEKKSFTLIELIVVISITGIIAGLVFANMRAGGGITDLNSDAERLGGIIKQAQMMSLTGRQTGGSRPAGGYGVYVSTNSYKLFADDQNVNNHQYDENGTNDTVIQTYTFSNNISLSAYDHYFIIFTPPKGVIYVGITDPGVLLTGTNKSLISLIHVSNRYAYVDINAQGQIDVRKVE